MKIELNYKFAVDLRNLLGVLIASFTTTEWLLYWFSHDWYDFWMSLYEWIPWKFREVLILEIFILFIMIQVVVTFERISQWSNMVIRELTTDTGQDEG